METWQRDYLTGTGQVSVYVDVDVGVFDGE